MKGIVSFTSFSREGHARTPRRLRRILKARRWPGTVARAEQVHGTRVVRVPLLQRPTQYPRADGLLTDVPGQPLAIFTADCIPLFLAVPGRRIVGLLHAGWRGVRGKILRESLRALRKHWRCSVRDVQVWMGPAIGRCCFEVQWDVAQYFPVTRRRRKNCWSIDLSKELVRQARRLGIPQRNIRPSHTCTQHQRQYFSYRRDQTDKRHASLIMLEKDI